MGAFDGECAALGIGHGHYSYPTATNITKEPETFYVCWDGNYGGSTGEHFDSKKEAIFFAQGMAGPLMGTECWFDVP